MHACIHKYIHTYKHTYMTASPPLLDFPENLLNHDNCRVVCVYLFCLSIDQIGARSDWFWSVYRYPQSDINLAQ